MAQPKGSTGNPSGKPKGVKNRKTIEWEELGHSLLTRHSGRANQIMSDCEDDVFMDNYTKLLEYFKPKQARTEIKMDGEMNVIFTRKDGNDTDPAQ